MSSVAIYHQKLDSRSETDPRKSKTSICFGTVYVWCCTCSDQHWTHSLNTEFHAEMPWATSGTGDHLDKQPPQVLHPIPFVFPKSFVLTPLLHNFESNHQYYPHDAAVPEWHSNALTDPYCSKGIPKPWDVILYEVSTQGRIMQLSPYTNRSYSTVVTRESRVYLLLCNHNPVSPRSYMNK